MDVCQLNGLFIGSTYVMSYSAEFSCFIEAQQGHGFACLGSLSLMLWCAVARRVNAGLMDAREPQLYTALVELFSFQENENTL